MHIHNERDEELLASIISRRKAELLLKNKRLLADASIEELDRIAEGIKIPTPPRETQAIRGLQIQELLQDKRRLADMTIQEIDELCRS